MATVKCGNTDCYTYRWLCRMVEYAGVGGESVEFISLCSIDDLPFLLAPKKERIRVVGGVLAANDWLCSLYADYVVVGEGFEFWAVARSRGLAAALELPCVWRRGRSSITPSSLILPELAPPIQLSTNKVMVLAGRGCHRKCRFCLPSWVTPHRVLQLDAICPKSLRLGVITNDSTNVDRPVLNRSITAWDYVRLTEKERAFCHDYRIGLESFTQQGRTWLGKPISNEIVAAAVERARDGGDQMILFVIAGIEPQESMLEFCDVVGTYAKLKPVLMLKMTYFEPHIHTPLARFDVRDIKPWSYQWVSTHALHCGPRFRVCMARDPGRAIARALIQRATTDAQVRTLWSCRAWGRDRLLQLVERSGWDRLWATPPPTRIAWPAHFPISRFGQAFRRLSQSMAPPAAEKR